MFFDDYQQIFSIAQKSGFSIFVLPHNQIDVCQSAKKPIKTAAAQAVSLGFPSKSTLVINPASGSITVDQIRDIIDRVKTHQSNDFFIVLVSAETMNLAAQNAFLKLLEEPSENYHFVLLTKDAAALLPTVLSRGALYFLRQDNPLSQPVLADEETKQLAKRIIAATPRELFLIATEISDKKKHKKPRELALQVTATAIEILYKSYFATNNPKFLKKLPSLIQLHAHLQANCHIKLHLVADLI